MLLTSAQLDDLNVLPDTHCRMEGHPGYRDLVSACTHPDCVVRHVLEE